MYGNAFPAPDKRQVLGMLKEIKLAFDDLRAEYVADVKTAISEAVTNAVIHGYENEIHKIFIRCNIKEETIYIEVEDHGKGIEDVKKAMEPLFTTKPEMDRSGMGFSFMEAFMDHICVESVQGEGTTVKMQKTIGKGRKLWTTQSL